MVEKSDFLRKGKKKEKDPSARRLDVLTGLELMRGQQRAGIPNIIWMLELTSSRFPFPTESPKPVLCSWTPPGPDGGVIAERAHN